MGQVNIPYINKREKFYLSRNSATLSSNGSDLINGRPFALGRNSGVYIPNIWNGGRWSKRFLYATFSKNFSQTLSDKHLMLYETLKSNHMLCHNELYVYDQRNFWKYIIEIA